MLMTLISKPMRWKNVGGITEMDGGMLYFAYGSNMDPAQIMERCPEATLVGLGYLADHGLCFPRKSKNAVAVCPPSSRKSATTPGASFGSLRTQICLRSIGTKGIATIETSGKRVQSPNCDHQFKWRVARNRNVCRVPQDGKHLPNVAYLAHLRDGAAHHGLPEPYRAYLEALPHDLSG